MAFKNLREDLEEMFAELTQRSDESDDAFEERRSWLLKKQRERMAYWRATHPVEYAAWLKHHREYTKRKLAEDPDFKRKKQERHRAYLKRRRQDPEYRAQETARNRERQSDPVFKAKRAAEKRAKYAAEKLTRSSAGR